MRRITFWIAGTLLTTLSAAAFAPASDNSGQFESLLLSRFTISLTSVPRRWLKASNWRHAFSRSRESTPQWNAGSLSDAKNIMLDFSPTGPSGDAPHLCRLFYRSRSFRVHPTGFRPKRSGFRCRARNEVCRSLF